MGFQFADTKKYQEMSQKLREILGSVLTPGKDYDERANVQLEKWVDGNPVHNYIDGECCPDFSCCVPDLLVDRYTRVRFRDAHQEEQMEYLMQFFGAGVEKMNPGVEVVMLDPVDDINELFKDEL